MVWNDYFDIEQDRRERPFRPLPSGRISRAAAAQFGTALVALGLLASMFAGWSSAGMRWTAVLLAAMLIVFILLYDRWLKRTWTGPLGMGTCRFLNVLLGFSVANGVLTSGMLPALVVGIYIVGVTWFARTEARQSSRNSLCGAAVVMLAAHAACFAFAGAVAAGHGIAVVFLYFLLSSNSWSASRYIAPFRSRRPHAYKLRLSAPSWA